MLRLIVVDIVTQRLDVLLLKRLLLFVTIHQLNFVVCKLLCQVKQLLPQFCHHRTAGGLVSRTEIMLEVLDGIHLSFLAENLLDFLSEFRQPTVKRLQQFLVTIL